MSCNFSSNRDRDRDDVMGARDRDHDRDDVRGIRDFDPLFDIVDLRDIDDRRRHHDRDDVGGIRDRDRIRERRVDCCRCFSICFPTSWR